MKKIIILILYLAVLQVFSQTDHNVYFEDTDYELHVYKIKGRRPGNTMMILGGIQGNEPGGYLSADQYVELTLAKGNLIVVPRANFISIITDKRGVNGDMNRKFADEGDTYEYKIVGIIKELMKEANVFLNLHDGSGFYRPEYISPSKNPLKYGQSIIADAESYYHEKFQNQILLKEIAEKIISRVNLYIENEEHLFRFNNHNTFSKSSLHKEQRKSATFYALGTYGIPAFGVETSKSIPLETKIRCQTLIINEFMKYYEILPEVPGLYLKPPELKFIMVSINDGNPIFVLDNSHIHINKGDVIEITHVDANYNRGLAVDVLKYGSFNDFRKKIRVFTDTRIIVKKDKFIAGNIEVRVGKSSVTANNINPGNNRGFLGVNYLLVEINNKKSFFSIGEEINLTKGDVIKIIDTVPSMNGYPDLRLNFYGYQPGSSNTNVAHDIGYKIDTETDLMPRFSVNSKGEEFKVRVEERDGGKVLESFSINIKEPVLEFVVIKLNDKSYHMENKEEISLSPDQTAEITKIQTNISKQKGISVNLISFDNKKIELKNIDLSGFAVKRFLLDKEVDRYEVRISKGRRIFGNVFIKIDGDMAKK